MLRKLSVVIIALLLLVLVVPAHAQGTTAFTYQGFLANTSGPVNSTCNFQFGVYAAPSGGSPLGTGTQSVSSVPVSDGRFTVQLNFGNVFNGAARYLQIAVQCSGDAGFTTLSPRQLLTPSPYSLYAASAANAATANSVDWNNINGRPSGLDDGDDEGITSESDPVWTAAEPDYNTAAELAADGGATVHWNNLTSLPAGFDDDIDNDTLAGLTCADGEIASWDDTGGMWVCAADMGGTTYTAGSGLVLTGTEFSVDSAALDAAYVNEGQADSVTSAMLVDGSVGSADIADGSVASVDIADGSVTGTDIADGSVTSADIDPAALSFWSLTGNAGTTPGADFIGTTDNVSLRFHVNGARVLELSPPPAGGTFPSPGVIGGHPANQVAAGVDGGTIAGGGAATIGNFVYDNFGTVGGGSDNHAGVAGATTDDEYATVAGGHGNVATSQFAFVGGGRSNIADGAYSTVPGGDSNEANQGWSFAAGRDAKANHQGVFIFSDSISQNFLSAADNEFAVRATGGFRLVTAVDPGTGVPTAGAVLPTGSSAWSAISDVNAKDNFQAVDGRAVLEALSEIDIATWNYRTQDPSIRHIGPMAQDFYAAFGVGEDELRISTIDADGVALAAVQGLYDVVQEKDGQIDALQADLQQTRLMMVGLAVIMLAGMATMAGFTLRHKRQETAS